MTIHVNNAGTWTVANEVYVNDAGTWREPQEIYINDAGTWRTVHKVVTVAANVNNLSLYSLAGSPTTAITLKVTVNAGVTITSSSTASAAVDISSFPAGSVIQLINNGTIYGAGGARGANGGGDGNPNPTWAVGNPPTTLSPATSSFVNGTYPNIRGNYSGALYYQGPGRGANWPDYNYYSGGTGPANGSPGENGGPALALNCNCALIINNSGLLVGGGGGGGGQAGNNRGGGAGGAGGYAMTYTGSHPTVTVNNLSGGILASGGGGAGGWGNRYEGEGHGGDYGQAGVSYHWTGAGSSPGGSLGLAPNNTGVTLVNTVGTFTVSPAA